MPDTSNDGARKVIKRVDALLRERSGMDGLWDQIDRFVAPARGQIYDTSQDEVSIKRKYAEIFDSTAVLSAQALGASLHSGLSSPADRWFSYRYKQEELNDNLEALRWLEDSADRVHNTIQDSNFNIEANSFYLNDVTFGTPVMFHGHENTGSGVKFSFRAASPKEVVFEVDYKGALEAVYQQRTYTAHQIVEQFPTTAPDSLRRAAEKRETGKPFTVIRCIMRNPAVIEGGDPSLLPAAKRPYIERHILRQGAIELTDAPVGYYDMPVYISKWGDVAGSKFGYSPAINSLPTVIVLNRLVKIILGAAEKAVDPPVLVTQRGLISDLDLVAGGTTVVRETGSLTPFENKARFDVSELNRQHLVTEVRQAFFADQLILPQNDRMTATEIRVRYERMQALLGPALYHLQSDFLSRMVDRSFGILLRNGALEPVPQVVLDKQGEPEIEFLGPLAKSQRLNAVVGLERGLGVIAAMAPVAPEVADVVKWTDAARDMFLRLGVPSDLLRSKAEVEEVRKEKASQRQQQQQLDAAQQRAQTAQAGSAAQLNIAKTGGING